MTLLPIHAFPARMAPNIAQESLHTVSKDGRVLDPMCGSGTVVRAAVEAGLHCTGIDIDPLSVLMSAVWVTPVEVSGLADTADDLVRQAEDLEGSQIKSSPDEETERFISFWFAPPQRDQLNRLGTVLRDYQQSEKDLLSIALSRTIVTKEMMASLARDTSHSRPHRVATENDFDVYLGFRKAVSHISNRLAPDMIKGDADVSQGDARKLDELEDNSFDLAITSPPYLNAIDYLRGHKLTLVWLGYKISNIRELRSTSIGAEKAPCDSDPLVNVSEFIRKSPDSAFDDRHLGWVRRYAIDMQEVIGELARVIKREGRVVLVIGNSFLRGATVDNAGLIERIAHLAGFSTEDKRVRSIPARRRYLPPPGDKSGKLDARMRKETVLTLTL